MKCVYFSHVPESIECWVISLVLPHGRFTQLPVSIGTIKSYLIALMFLHWILFFLSVKIFYLSLLFQRFIIICLNIYKFLFISLAWYLLGFWNYNSAFINSGKLLAIISSSITATPILSLLPKYQWIPLCFFSLSPSLLFSLSLLMLLCLSVPHCG